MCDTHRAGAALNGLTNTLNFWETSMYDRLLVKVTMAKSFTDGRYYITMQEDFYQPEVRSLVDYSGIIGHS